MATTPAPRGAKRPARAPWEEEVSEVARTRRRPEPEAAIDDEMMEGVADNEATEEAADDEVMEEEAGSRSRALHLRYVRLGEQLIRRSIGRPWARDQWVNIVRKVLDLDVGRVGRRHGRRIAGYSTPHQHWWRLVGRIMLLRMPLLK